MIFTNQEKLLKFLNVEDVDDDIEANPAKSIEEEDTELVNCHGHDHLQDLLLITGIPLIAIDINKEDANDKGKCKDNEGTQQMNDRSSSSCTASSDIAGGSLTSHDLFLSQVKCGLMLGIFLVWPAIRIFLFTLLTKCEPFGNIFFAKDIKEQQDQPEMPNWLMAFVYVPLSCTSGAWHKMFIVDHKVFLVETILTNFMILCMHLKPYITKSGCLCNGKLYGIMYSSMVMNAVSFLGQVNPENMTVELWVLIAIILSSSAIILALVGYYAASKLVPFTAVNGAVDVPDMMRIAYTVCVADLGLLMYFTM
uniref:Uncharacterized protein n=1 Tax=Chaetoceros debilis TaxID=122233 RepID=A0A7S3QBX6_9STRA